MNTAKKTTARLLIDIGNSRLKWCIAKADVLGALHALNLPARGLPDLEPMLRAARRVNGVVLVSVAGPARDRALFRRLRAAGLPAPQVVHSASTAAGVSNGYREPWRLGADRWVAAIGAWHAAGARRPVCVIDVGTAATIDVVDATGHHRGGLIAPGPALMTRSLLAGTRGIAPRTRGTRLERSGSLARDTGNAIHHGAMLATAGFIELAIRQARREVGRGTTAWLTGGAAAELLPLLGVAVRHEPDLVLQGLAVLAD